MSNSAPLYIVMISIHGLIRGKDLELGRDADTGGQTKYVVELARALASRSEVERVDLVTRRLVDPALDSCYAQPIEPLASKARIVRIDAGPEAYLPKEELWPHLDGFTDRLLGWLHQQPRLPDLLHSHYADAGYVGVRLAQLIGLPLVHTGHSLGRDKLRRLAAAGLGVEEIEERYRMSQRIEAEEQTLSNAALVITSTRNEIEDQYELYDCYTPEKMAILPPGTDLQQFHPPRAAERDAESAGLREVLGRFLRDPGKPVILALSRPDERKNIVSLLEAYGCTPRLREIANLVIVAGNRDDIRTLHEGAQQVLKELLLVIDAHDLYGSIALPKHHTSAEVAVLYRLAAASGGVFVNPALTEPFGLALLEAAASGLPLVATENGGPVDIIENCRNGLLVDPLDEAAIARALLRILEDPELWRRFSASGLETVPRTYSWQAHAVRYLQAVRGLARRRPPALPAVEAGRQARLYREWALFSAIDNTLLGDPQALERLGAWIREHRRRFLFGIATGRRLGAALKILKQHGIPAPDVLVTSLGTEIHYLPQLTADIAWTRHIDHLWTPKVVRRLLDDLPGLSLQPPSEQSRFKISYTVDTSLAPPIEELFTLFRQQELAVDVTLSFGQFLDLIPSRASKGKALRSLARQWRIPLERVLVAGGSRGDEDMLRGNTLGVVVTNPHSEELRGLQDLERVYFSPARHAGGILDALEHYRFLEDTPGPAAAVHA